MKYVITSIEFIPVILAIVSMIITAASFKNLRRRQDFIVKILMLIASVLLIVAQTSWWQSVIIDNDLMGTWFSNQVWLVFNTIVMITFILSSLPRNKND